MLSKPDHTNNLLLNVTDKNIVNNSNVVQKSGSKPVRRVSDIAYIIQKLTKTRSKMKKTRQDFMVERPLLLNYPLLHKNYGF